jgi:hypothetical protein
MAKENDADINSLLRFHGRTYRSVQVLCGYALLDRQPPLPSIAS